MAPQPLPAVPSTGSSTLSGRSRATPSPAWRSPTPSVPSVACTRRTRAISLTGATVQRIAPTSQRRRSAMEARMGCGPPTLPSPHPASRTPHPAPCTPAPCTPHPASPVTPHPPLTLPSPPPPTSTGGCGGSRPGKVRDPRGIGGQDPSEAACHPARVTRQDGAPLSRLDQQAPRLGTPGRGRGRGRGR